MSLRVAEPGAKARGEPSDPRASAFVAANAGAGKTYTLVQRVARLLLSGTAPEAILCVTYTKAGAAEMQRRLFAKLGEWAVAPSEKLKAELAEIGETRDDLSGARKLFAQALETPGGLKIQTIHAFCEKLLRRFPLEAGVSPNFAVLEDAAAAELSARARDGVARIAMAYPDSETAAAYNHFSVELDYESFKAMFAAFETRRTKIAAHIARCGGEERCEADVWKRCGFKAPTEPEAVQAEALDRVRLGQWRRAAEALAASEKKSDQDTAAKMTAFAAAPSFEGWCGVFLTGQMTPRARLATQGVDAWAAGWLAEEQERVVEAVALWRSAVVARDTCRALVLAGAYAAAYQVEKSHRGGLDFDDLIARTHRLLTTKGDAAWVLFKLDGGIDHLLLDEAQDTAPEQWDILRALTAEFFVDIGAGARRRTVFAVGDDKQSIFSFQGARPERFGAEGRAYKALVESVGRAFIDAELLTSRRSAPEVLAFVDKVFAHPAALAGLRPGLPAAVMAMPVIHRAVRGEGGCVEAWPLEATDPAEELDPWEPVDAEPRESANRKLARRIAVAVRGMIDRREGVVDRESGSLRPCAAGDVLILVRRRNALFHEIIRALKRAGVPVGGADRLKLSDHAVFQDLVALGRFARFPADDLTLAALLRSPFCDVDEESLFDLAFGRAGGLWGVLERRANERPEWEAAHRFLAWAIDEARARPPFDFYSRVLSYLDGAGRSMRARMLTRLGTEAQDALDAFLAEAVAAEGRDIRDLERFLAAMAATEIEVKREQEDAGSKGGGEVRVMTAHGAKGLEAPIVILPDTSTKATSQGGPLLETADGGFLWAPRKGDDCDASGEARTRRDELGDQESLRLLYVALTRARDRLIVGGTQTLDRYFKGSWRDYVDQAFAGLEAARPIALDGGGEGLRFGADPGVAEAAMTAAAVDEALPAWSARPPPPEPAALRFASPSTMAEETRGSSPSPLSAVGGLGRFRRGDIIHRLLQRLPDLPADERADGAAALLAREPGLTDGQRAEMAAAALGVLADPQFAEVFGPGSRAEVALAGAAARLPAGLAISGRVDRLVVTPSRVLVIDFKTNRPAPATIEAADGAYIAQMAVYRAVLAEVFQDRRIEAALVWTDGPRLMPVTEKLMDQALDALAANS